MTPEERKKKLNDILELLQDSGFIYDKSKGGVHGMTQMPPPLGTRMNCESAARIFMQLASDMGIDGLQAMYYSGGETGYFVPANGKQALGGQPEVNTQAAKGWEFDNHWRVKDNTTGIIYDPTFGTCSPNNLTGIVGSSMTTGLNFQMTTIYGEKIKIVRQGIRVETSLVNQMPVNAKYNVTDNEFKVKAMTHLRV